MNKCITLVLGITACLCSAGIARERPLLSTTTSPATQPATARQTPRSAANALLDGIEQRDEAALAQVIAPSKAGSAEVRATQTLAGKGKLGPLNTLIREGASFTTAGEHVATPEDGREVVRLLLDMTDKRGKVRGTVGGLEIFRFEDGWRVDDFDFNWGPATKPKGAAT